MSLLMNGIYTFRNDTDLFIEFYTAQDSLLLWRTNSSAKKDHYDVIAIAEKLNGLCCEFIDNYPRGICMGEDISSREWGKLLKSFITWDNKINDWKLNGYLEYILKETSHDNLDEYPFLEAVGVE